MRNWRWATSIDISQYDKLINLDGGVPLRYGWMAADHYTTGQVIPWKPITRTLYSRLGIKRLFCVLKNMPTRYFLSKTTNNQYVELDIHPMSLNYVWNDGSWKARAYWLSQDLKEFCCISPGDNGDYGLIAGNFRVGERLITTRVQFYFLYPKIHTTQTRKGNHCLTWIPELHGSSSGKCQIVFRFPTYLPL